MVQRERRDLTLLWSGLQPVRVVLLFSEIRIFVSLFVCNLLAELLVDINTILIYQMALWYYL